MHKWHEQKCNLNIITPLSSKQRSNKPSILGFKPFLVVEGKWPFMVVKQEKKTCIEWGIGKLVKTNTKHVINKQKDIAIKNSENLTEWQMGKLVKTNTKHVINRRYSAFDKNCTDH